MASGRHCEECIRLTDLYLNRVSYHASLVDGGAKTIQVDGDLEWKILQTEKEVHEARERFLAHRALHSIRRQRAGQPEFEPESDTKCQSRPSIVRVHSPETIAEVTPNAAPLRVTREEVATFESWPGETFSWRQCTGVLLRLLATLGIFYALPSLLEMLLIHRHAAHGFVASRSAILPVVSSCTLWASE